VNGVGLIRLKQTITYLTHKVTCAFEWSLAGYVWRTTNEIPNYLGCLAEKTFEKLEATAKSTIDR
jgi:hypothetical protein